MLQKTVPQSVRGTVLTIDHKSNVCQQYAHRDYKNEFLPVPDGDSSNLR